MQSVYQALLITEIFIYVVLMLRVLLHGQLEEVERYLFIFLALSVIPLLVWLGRLTYPAWSLPLAGIIASWARIVPVLAFGALTMAFVRQSRWALAWLGAGAALFALMAALQLGWLGQFPGFGAAAYRMVWILALGGATLVLLFIYRRQTSPLHRNRFHYWVVALALLLAAEGVSLAAGFTPQVLSRAFLWIAAGLATYIVLEVHPPELSSLLRQALHFLMLTAILGLVLFAILLTVRAVRWPTLTERDTLLLVAVIAVVMAIVLPGLLSLARRVLNQLIFGSEYDEQEVVRHYSQGISNILDIDRLASVAFDVINQVFHIERGALLLVQFSGGGHSMMLPVRALGEVPTQLFEVETFGTLMNRFRQGTPLTQYDVDMLPALRRIRRPERERLSRMGMELYVPIRSQDEVMGVLALGPKRSGEPYRHNDLNLLRTLADQTVAALKNAQMVHDMRQLNLDISRLNVELESMNQTKDDFITIASHELRTPLTQVHGYSEMLAESVEPESPLSMFVNGLVKGTARLTEIVDVMLDVSRLGTGELKLKRALLNLDQVVQRAADEWTPALEERGHTLTVQGLDTLPAIEGDAERLQQVFSQLINNAIKYTPDGGTLEISGQVHAESNGLFVEAIVKDNGIGIDPDDQHRIFDKFYRTGDLMKHSTGKTKFMGAGPGLGLSLVKAIVDAHGGRVWAESPGHDEEDCPGSSFHVLLPLQRPGFDPAMVTTMVHRRPAGNQGRL